MNVNQIIDDIKIKSAENGYFDVVKAIDLRTKSGSTGSEITAMIGKYLFDLKTENADVYKTLEASIKAYLEYCKINGIIIS